jgi:hypothetical protein
VHWTPSSATFRPICRSTSRPRYSKLADQHASLVPAITTVTQTGKRITIADAKNRSFRTLFQNLAVDLMVGLITALPMLVT